MILVLLIIFMVAAPLSTVDVPVDLPVSNAHAAAAARQAAFLTLKGDSRSRSATTPVRATGWRRPRQATGGDREQRVFLRADRASPMAS